MSHMQVRETPPPPPPQKNQHIRLTMTLPAPVQPNTLQLGASCSFAHITVSLYINLSGLEQSQKHMQGLRVIDIKKSIQNEDYIVARCQNTH